MEKNESRLRIGARGRGAVWASLALAAGLAAAPGAALADEAVATPAAEGQQQATAATTATSQPQAAAAVVTDGKAATDQADVPSQQQADGQATAAAQTTQRQESPAASSDKGTYEKAGLHQVTVTYVDADGSQIAPAHREALADGESYAVQSPTVGGYELADASQATVSGTVAKGSGDVSVVVKYRSTLVTYTVVHERQVGPRSSEYRVSETETLTAPSGTKVTAAPRSYDNYTCATGAEGRTAEVTPDGKTTIVIKYDVIVPTYGVYFSTNGSYVAPQTGRVGDAVTAPADPTRAGYAFAGWDTDGDGVADALPSTIPDRDVTATAVWEPAHATYLVKYWGEDQGDDVSTYKYHLLKTVTLTGKTEFPISADKLDTSKGGEYQWYTYKGEDQGLTVSGDGTTVLNVYYDWKKVRVYYRAELDGTSDYSMYPDVILPVEKKMYDFIGLLDGEKAFDIYKAKGGALKRFLGWKDVGSQYTINDKTAILPSTVTWLDDGNLEARILAQFTNSELTDHYMLEITQTADGASYTETRHYTWLAKPSHTHWTIKVSRGGLVLAGWRTSTNVWDGADESTITWGEWHPITAKDVNSEGKIRTPDVVDSKSNVFQFKFDRVPYDVTYYSNGRAVASEKHFYGSSFLVSTPEGLTAPEGRVFAGWYTSPTFEGDPATSLTMPEGGVDLHALWKRPDVTVTFDAAGGSAVAPETVAWGGKAKRPADPVREGYQFGGWYYQGAGSSTPAPFPFDLALQADARLVAAWRSTNTPTTYTVRHVLADGTVLLEQELPGTVGQTVSALALPRGDARRRGHAYASASGATIDLAADASRNVITFAYSDDASRAYVVHLWDEATGLPVAADVEFDSVEALLDYLAPEVPGWHVLFGGRGYLSAREGGQELTFWYERDPEPAQPAAPAARATYEPRHTAAVPSTGDAASPAAPAAAGAIGLGLAALGALLRRRRED